MNGTVIATVTLLKPFELLWILWKYAVKIWTQYRMALSDFANSVIGTSIFSPQKRFVEISDHKNNRFPRKVLFVWNKLWISLLCREKIDVPIRSKNAKVVELKNATRGEIWNDVAQLWRWISQPSEGFEPR